MIQSTIPKRHLDRFSRFCTVYQCDQHSDRHTDHATCVICQHRILCTAIKIRPFTLLKISMYYVLSLRWN